MYYAINVALNGRHFFATAERSITSIEHAAQVYEKLCLALPETDGYDITVKKQERWGYDVTYEVKEYLNRGRM